MPRGHISTGNQEYCCCVPSRVLYTFAAHELVVKHVAETHELVVKHVAETLGSEQISISSEVMPMVRMVMPMVRMVMPMVRMVPRGGTGTTCVDAFTSRLSSRGISTVSPENSTLTSRMSRLASCNLMAD